MRFPSIVSVLLLAPALLCSAAKEVPSWVEEVSTRKLPAYSGKVPAAVLLEDQHVSMDQSGMVTITERHAVKILNQQGKREASVIVHYWKARRDVKDFHAWLIAPSGFQKTYEKSSVADVGAFSDAELYTDGRARMIAAENPEIGSVFVYEYTVQERALTAQAEFVFQTRLPSLQSRYTVSLPPGWTANALVFNRAAVQPVIDGSSYSWELKDLPFREGEGESASTFPRLAVSFQPPADATSVAPVFRSWGDVSRWNYGLAEGQDEVTPEISAKVAELTSSAKSDYEKIRAIGHYVQNIRYVAIEMDLQNGGGYIPNTAGAVFSKQYGDCKDKANLMRSMLKAAGLSSYLVAIYGGDRTYVREQWPSPLQFNHMILAAKVADTVSAPTAISSPLGRLLIFDPTDEKTPMGDLPWYEQGSFALLLAGDHGDLLRMPATQPEANTTDFAVEAALTPEGSLSASFTNSKGGQPASMERHHLARENAEEYKTGYQRFLNDSAKGVVISKLATDDHFEQNKFDLTVSFDSSNYAQLVQGRLLIFRPAIVEIAPSIAPRFPKDEQRAGPIVLRATLYRKTVHVKLPAGFTIDEAPIPAKMESDFATFVLSFKQEPGMLTMTEELRTEAATLAPDQFDKVKKFFDYCRGADDQNVVLAKD